MKTSMCFTSLCLGLRVPKLAALLEISQSSFTFSTANLAPFMTWSTTLSNLLTGLESSQPLCRTKLNAMFSLFWQQLGQTKRPHYIHVGTSYTHNIGFSRKKNVSATHQIEWGARGDSLLQTPINIGTTPFKLPCCTRHLGQRAAEKPSTFLDIFLGLSVKPMRD